MTASSDKLAEWFDRLCSVDQAARRAGLARLGQRDPALAAELQSLLDVHDRAPDFLGEGPAERFAELMKADEQLLMPERAGPYRLLREVGRGGLGVVYLAERTGDEFDQQVAVKLIKHGMDTESILQRFYNERRILASLEHPNIARLIDGGMLADGRPWFAMEYIRGKPVTAWCDEKNLSIRARLELFERVCRTVQHAHSRLIIHRDLKPDNILITDDGAIKVLDFGIAKLLAESSDPEAQLTVAGTAAMTPEYAAPEQIREEPVSVATDVYSLGVIFYRLVAGVHPFAACSDNRAELSEAVCTTSPPLPSVSAGRIGCPVRWRRELRGGLDSIALAAMARNPGDRYNSAESMAEDIRRYLDRIPVRARRGTPAYRARQFLSRHRLVAVATAAVVLALAGGMSAALWQAREARQQAHLAEESTRFVISLLQDSNPTNSQAGVQLRAVDLLDNAAERVEGADHIPASLQARLRTVIAEGLLELGALDRALPLAERAVGQSREVHGEGIELAEALHPLARVRVQLGHSNAAAAAAGEGIAILDSSDHYEPLLMTRLLGIQARISNMRGDFAGSFRMRQRLLDERVGLYGPGDPRLASSHYNLATAAFYDQQYALAEHHYRESGRLLQLEADADHPLMANVVLGIGAAIGRQGRLDAAEAALDEAERITRMRLGPDVQLMAIIGSHRGRLHLFRGEREAAIEVLQAAAEHAAGQGVRFHEAASRTWLGIARLDQGRPGEALPELERAAALLAERGMESHPVHGVANVAGALAMAWSGATGEALDRGREALERMEADGHRHSDHFGEASELYAALLRHYGRPREAAAWQERAASVLAAGYGDGHPRVQSVGSLYLAGAGSPAGIVREGNPRAQDPGTASKPSTNR